MTAVGERFDPRSFHTFRYLGWEVLRDGLRDELRDRPNRDANLVEVQCTFSLEGAGASTLTFVERFEFPVAPGNESSDGVLADHDHQRLSAALDVLMVSAGTSYFKAAAPARVSGVPEWLAGFAGQLYLHGLAEFALVNDLDPVRPEFSTVPGAVDVDPGGMGLVGAGNTGSAGSNSPVLVAVGGGKDSIVAIELLRSALAANGSGHERPLVVGSVRTHRAIEATARTAGLAHLVINREIDPALLRLNDVGALNGHVPVTAINSAALAVCAVLNGFGTVVMSNEWSASVPVAEHRGLAVNHQWSKSLACEQLLAGLLPVEYFSILRPLHEVEICRRFAALPQYFDVVTSCNRAYTAVGRAAGTRWCGDCPKCRFVYLGLAPFLPPADLDRIFEGVRLLDDAHGVEAYRSIVGLSGTPPLECVGTVEESRWAVQRLARGAEGAVAWRDAVVVRALAQELSGTRVAVAWDPLLERGEHAIPQRWTTLLNGTGVVPDGHRGDHDAPR